MSITVNNQEHYLPVGCQINKLPHDKNALRQLVAVVDNMDQEWLEAPNMHLEWEMQHMVA